MPAMLNTLSQEILSLICQRLEESRDVRNFRLTCKALAACGMRFLVPRVTVPTLPIGYKRLRDITNHEVLRLNVKEILLPCIELPEYTNYNDFARASWNQDELDWPISPNDPFFTPADLVAWNRHQCPEEIREKQWKSYNEFRARLVDRDSIGDDFSFLSQIFARLPKLKSVRAEIDTCALKLSRFLSRIPGNERAMEDLPDMRDDIVAAGKHLEMIIAVLLKAKTPLQRLEISDIDGKFFFIDSPSLDALSQIVPNLRELSLSITFSVEDESLSEPWENYRNGLEKGGLHGILTSAPILEHLKLHVASAFMEDHITSFNVTFGDLIWPRLRHLDLGGFDATAQELTDFMANHASSLKVLKMEDIYLQGAKNDKWYSFFISLATMLDLEEANFDRSFQTELSLTIDNEVIDMRKIGILGMDIGVGQGLGYLICYTPRDEERDLYRGSFEYLLKTRQARIPPSLYKKDMGSPVNDFLRSIVPK